MIRLQVDVRQIVRHLDDVAQRQVPFALAKAVNATALDAQQALRAHFDDVFDITRPTFLHRQGAKMLQFAKKGAPTAILGTDPKADFLFKFTTGEEKRPIEGSSLAVPVNLRRGKSRSSYERTRPSSLLSDRGRYFIVRAGDPDPRVAHLAPGIYRRMGRGGRSRAQLVYSLIPSASTPKVLRYEEIAEQTVDAKFEDHFYRELAKAIRSAK